MIGETYILMDDDICKGGRFKSYVTLEVFWNRGGGITIKDVDRSPESDPYMDMISLTPTQAKDLIEVLQNMLNSDD